MAIDDTHPRRPWRVLAGLFEEAWERERKRRRWSLILLVLAGAAAITIGLTQRGGSSAANDRASAASGQRIASGIKSATLPISGTDSSLTVANGQLVVVAGSYLYFTGGRCVSGTVNPATLRIAAVMHASCADPALYHQRVLPLAYVDQHHDPAIGNNGLMGLRIATVAPGTRDGYTLGPTVMTYPQVSDEGPRWAYGDGSLWVFDPLGLTTTDMGARSQRYEQYARSGAGGDAGELVRVSLTTGRVLQRWRLPSLDRALIAVDADGLWIAPSLYTGYPIGISGTARRAYQTLYLAAPGERKLRAVRDLGPDGVQWMVASGHTVWVEDDTNLRQSVTRLRLQGPNGTLIQQARSNRWGPQGAEYGEGDTTFGGTSSVGVYDVVSAQTSQSVVWMNPSTLEPRIVAKLNPPITGDGGLPSTAAYDGAFFVLDQNSAIQPGDSVLYRVKSAGSN